MKKLVAAIVLAVALTGACAADDPPEETQAAGGDCTDNSKDEGQADLEMQDFVFAPPCLQINSGQGLRVHNEGKVKHNWTVEGKGLDIDVEPGQENNTEATGLDVGTYKFFCKYHRESHDMEGELRVLGT